MSVKELAKGETVSRSWCFLVVYFCSSTYSRCTAVSFQFSRIGNDLGAAKFLEGLDQDPDIGENISVLPVEFDLKQQLTHRWFVVCHDLLLSKLIN